jgi:hypothetical protein
MVALVAQEGQKASEVDKAGVEVLRQCGIAEEEDPGLKIGEVGVYLLEASEDDHDDVNTVW